MVFAGKTARTTWQVHTADILCNCHDEMLAVANDMAYELVQVISLRNEWYLEIMYSHGALFLGPPTNVAHGDKLIGTYHTLPRPVSGRSTGALRVGMFPSTHRYHEVTTDSAAPKWADDGSGPCLSEGPFEHAEQCRIRARRYGGRNEPCRTAAQPPLDTAA